jgi:O-succinylbenzoic acid--CoA ligase
MLASPWLTQRAAITPERTACLLDGRALTYAELEQRAQGLAEALRLRGVRAGDVVAALLGNGLAFVELVHAVDRCAATLLPLNARLTPRELCFQLGDSSARALLHADDELAALARATGNMAPGLEMVSWSEIRKKDPSQARDPAPRAVDPGDPLAILYTSGTTGRPKGVYLSRANFLWSAVSSAFHLGVDAGDRWLACLPLFHVGGLSIPLRSVLYGSAVVVHERFDPAAVSRALDAEAITHVSLTAMMLQRLLEARGARPAPPRLRCALIGGGPCPGALLERARERGLPVAPTYGLTEATAQVATRPPSSSGPADGPLTPLLGTQLRIVDARGAQVPPGSEGEIWLRGPTVMSGYVRDPSPGDTVLRDGWLRTGDVGTLDAAGRLRVLDRRSDLIVSGGDNVYPAEVEAALLEHPAVEEAGVAGIADREYGRRPVAWWRPRPDANAPSASALRAFCRERLAGYKVPVAFHRVEALPRNSAGKLLRHRLGGVADTDTTECE